MDVGIVHGKELPLAGERYSPYADISNEFTDLFEPFMVDLSLLEEIIQSSSSRRSRGAVPIMPTSIKKVTTRK